MTVTPARDIRIWSDDEGYVQYAARKGSEADLVGNWLTSDVQGSSSHLIMLLDAIESLRSGRTNEPYESNGNAWYAVITKDQIQIENKYVDHMRGTVAVDTALSIMRSYWDALGDSSIREGKEYFLEFNQREPQLPW